MAVALAILAKERDGPKITFQVPFYPVTEGTNFNSSSYIKLQKGYWLTRQAMKAFGTTMLLIRQLENSQQLHLCRLQSSNLEDHPPALIIRDEFDVLHSEGEAYAHKLIDAGVPVTAVRYFGTTHDFVMLNALADTPASTWSCGSSIRSPEKGIIGLIMMYLAYW
jgi:acetyl esterase/lipase